MLRTLLESNAPRQRRGASTAASIAVHTAVIAGAIVATASARTDPSRDDRRPERPPVYVPIGDPQRRPMPQPKRLAKLPSPDQLPRPDRWTFTYSPNSVPTPITDIDPATLLPADTIGGVGPRGPGGWPFGDPAGRALGDHPATIATVDRAAALIRPPRPRYPDQLRAAGVTGRVVVRLVVDTTGRVELTSVVVWEASHDLFAQAVQGVLPALRFTPAEAGGRKVRMLVELPFEFRLDQ